MFTPTLRHLFHPDNLEEYLDSIRTGSDHLATTLGRVSGPSTGTSPGRGGRARRRHRPRRPDRGPRRRPGGAVAGLPRRRDLVPRAVVRRAPELPRRHPGPARRAVRLVGELLPGHLRPERRRHPHRAPPRRLDGRPHRLPTSADRRARVGPRRRHLHQRRHPVQPAGPAAGPRHRGRDARRPARPAARAGLRRRPLQRREVRPAARARRRTPSSRSPFDRSHRMRVPALEAGRAGCLDDDLVPMAVVATAGTTDFGAIDPLRRIAGVCDRFGVWLHVDGAYGGGLLASRRRRHLLDGIELADSVTIDFHKTWFLPVSASAVVVRDGRTPAPRHPPRRLPEPRRPPPTPTRSTRACRPRAGSTRSSSG